jgi:hypothetical protein
MLPSSLSVLMSIESALAYRDSFSFGTHPVFICNAETLSGISTCVPFGSIHRSYLPEVCLSHYPLVFNSCENTKC